METSIVRRAACCGHGQQVRQLRRITMQCQQKPSFTRLLRTSVDESEADKVIQWVKDRDEREGFQGPSRRTPARESSSALPKPPAVTPATSSSSLIQDESKNDRGTIANASPLAPIQEQANVSQPGGSAGTTSKLSTQQNKPRQFKGNAVQWALQKADDELDSIEQSPPMVAQMFLDASRGPVGEAVSDVTQIAGKATVLAGKQVLKVAVPAGAWALKQGVAAGIGMITKKNKNISNKN